LAVQMTTSQQYFVIAALLWSICRAFNAGAPVVAVLGAVLIWQLRLSHSHTTLLALSVLLGYVAAFFGLLLWSLVLTMPGLMGITWLATSAHHPAPYVLVCARFLRRKRIL
jgi:hypothetical protein